MTKYAIVDDRPTQRMDMKKMSNEQWKKKRKKFFRQIILLYSIINLNLLVFSKFFLFLAIVQCHLQGKKIHTLNPHSKDFLPISLLFQAEFTW